MARTRRDLRPAVASCTALLLSLGTLAGCGTGASAGGGPSGDALKVMVMGPISSAPGVQTPPQKELAVGAKAAAKAVNDAGGIDGTKIDLVTCDSQGTKNGGVTCANKAVQEQVAAVVGAVDFYGDYTTVLKAAGIPNVGPLPLQVELSDDNSWPVEGGASVVPAGAVTFAAGAGGSSLAYVGNESAYTSSIPEITKPVVRAHPGFRLNMIAIPATATDLSAYVARARGSDYVDVATFAPNNTQSFIKGYIEAGGDPGHLLTSASTLNSAVLGQLGDTADGVRVTSLFVPAGDTTSPAAVAFGKAMDAVDAKAPKNEIAQNSYVAVRLLAAALKGKGAGTPQEVSKALAAVRNLDLGLIPPISFDTATKGAPAPRIFNDAIVLSTVRDGALLTSSDKPFSAYTGRPLGQ
jgi:branched-chain amino acid transport system substrate-binding protein